MTARPLYEARVNGAEDNHGETSSEYLEALADLEGCWFPEELQYLKDWSLELFGRSGVGESGFAPCSFETLYYWSKKKKVQVEPHEIDALILLDSIRRYPPKEVVDDDGS